MPDAKPVLQEIATSRDGRDVTRAFMGDLAFPQDGVLAHSGFNWGVYREIRRDGQVHAAFLQRRSAITARPLVVEPGAPDRQSIAAADQLRLNLKSIGFNRATKAMAWGLFYGFSVAECMWTRRDGMAWLETIKVRTPWRFRFGSGGELRLLTRSAPTGEAMPDEKFWVLSTGADNDDEPYGLGLAHHLHWPVYFKKQGLAFWLRALEKFGAPSIVGAYPPGTPIDDQEKLLAAANALRLDGAVVTPDDMSLAILEAKRGTVDQAVFVRQMNAEISKIILGQTMTTDDGASLAQGQVHQAVKEEFADADISELCETFRQGPARWLTRWNFPGAAVPKLSRPSPTDHGRDADIRQKNAEALKTMAEAGFEPMGDAVASEYPGWRKKL